MRIDTKALQHPAVCNAYGFWADQSPRASDALATFVAPQEGAKACWAVTYDADFLAKHPNQQVKHLAMAMHYRREAPESDGDETRLLALYALSVEFRDGRRGKALGNCLPGDGGAIWCGVECDGGSVDVRHGPEGSLILDLSRTKQIRLQYCGDAGEKIFLRASGDVQSYALTPVNRDKCPDISMPSLPANVE